MQMQLKQAHIEAAIRDFVAKAGIQFPIDEINFTAGRGKDGLTATIDLEDPFSSLLDQASSMNPASAERPAKEKSAPAKEAEPDQETEPQKEEAKEEPAPDQAFVEEEESPFSDPTPVAAPAKANGASLFS